MTVHAHNVPHMTNPSANTGQQQAIEKLLEGGNVFLTGAAGTGKSFVVQRFLEEKGDMRIALLATTGAASIIIDGRTFHSFFGLWNFHAGYDEMVRTALQMRSLYDRVRGTECIVIDEVSMLNSRTIKAGEEIARRVRQNDAPWGGMQVIATGDFCQLPPVTTTRDREEGFCEKGQTDWVFNSDVWDNSRFKTIELTEIMRTSEARFLGVLAKLRMGVRDDEVQAFLEERIIGSVPAENSDMPMLFSRKANVVKCNDVRLGRLQGREWRFRTIYNGDESAVKKLKTNCPLDEELVLRDGALVMIRTNDPNGYPYQYANGSLGHFLEHDAETDVLRIRLKSGQDVEIRRKEFHWKNGDGRNTASAINFPVNVGYSTTIHKSQGATMDNLIVDMGNVWESGQAYVALSRVRGEEGLRVLRPSRGKVFLEDAVKKFYKFPLTV
jgi:ATP-dependent DNA helicase PIF1